MSLYLEIPVPGNTFPTVPTGIPSRGGDVAVYVSDINQPSLPTPFYSVLMSVPLFMVLSAVFHQGMDKPRVLPSPRGQWRTEKNGGNWL